MVYIGLSSIRQLLHSKRFMLFNKNNINASRQLPKMKLLVKKLAGKCATTTIRVRLRCWYGPHGKCRYRGPATIAPPGGNRNLGFLVKRRCRKRAKLLFENCTPFRVVCEKQYRCGCGGGGLRLSRRNLRLFHQ